MFNELITLYPITAYSFLGVFSLLIGSLLNVIIYRLPLMLHDEWAAQCRELLGSPEEPRRKINLFFPRSFCPHCKSMIPLWHNIPFISYCILRGKCSNCKHSIPFRYPLVEALSFSLSLFAAWNYGFNESLVMVLLFIWIVICLIFIDLEHQLLPDVLTLGLLWLGLIANTQELFTSLPNAVLSAAGAYLALWLFINLFFLLTHKVGMGHGDFKLFAAFGAWFGWTQLPLILLLSSITGAIIGIVYLKRTAQSKETPIPFGPFLCLSGIISLFYGESIVQWYLHFFMQ